MVRPAYISGVILLATACGEHKLEVRNASPTAVITSHSDGAVVVEDTLTVIGSVSDPDDSASELLAAWLQDGETICEMATPSDEGVTFCELTLSPGETEIQLQVRDPGNAVDTDTITLSMDEVEVPNTPPTCAITAPEAGELLSPAEDVVLMGTAADVDQDPHTLTAVWRSDRDGPLGTVAPTTDGDVHLVSSGLSPGAHVIALSVTDDADEMCVDSVVIQVGTPPEITITEPAPGIMFALGTPISASARVSDAEDTGPEMTVQWTLSDVGSLGVSTPDATGVVSLSTDAGLGAYSLTATVTDSHGQTASDSVDFTVDDVPIVSDVVVAPKPAWTVDLLSCSWLFTDSSGTDASTADWTINGAPAGTGTTLSGGFVHGDMVVCTVTPSDGGLTGESASDSVVISNSPPSISAVNISPATPTAADTLSCAYTGFSDLDGEADLSTLLWAVNGVAAGSAPTLSGVFSRGDVVSCTVTPHDGTDAGTPASDAVTIGNTPPEVTSVALSPSDVFTHTTVSVMATMSDAEDDPVTLQYAWTVDGVPVAVSSSSLSGVDHFDKHQVLAVTVTPNDGFVDGPSVTSVSITVQNSPPVPPSLIFIPEEPVEGEDDVWCAVDSPATDPDGDAVALQFDWALGEVVWSGSLLTTSELDDTVPLTETSADQIWTCTVTPNDGETDGAERSAEVTIDNAETRVFVTNEATSSGMGGPTGGDAFCTTLAEEAGLGGSWVAYLSGGGGNAITRIPDGPYVRLDGALIAEDKADLTDGSIATPININQLGGTTSVWVCTGSSEAGTATGPATASGGNCQGWTRGCGVCDGDHWYAEVGRSAYTNDDWSTAGWNFCGSCYLYCFEA
jgi:hypothetical protein